MYYYAIVIEYYGVSYCGWQKQQSCLTQKQQSSCPCRHFPAGGKSFVQGYSTPITATSISTNGWNVKGRNLCT